LFEKTAHFAQEDGALEHHAALVALFEILEVASRADLKMDLIQELERQRQTLLAFRNNPEISEEALSGALYEIEQSSAALLASHGKIGQYLRENDWLMSIKSRAAIPGGVCEFDLPSYHWWLHRPVDTRREALEAGPGRCCRCAMRPPSCCACCAPAAGPRTTWRPSASSSSIWAARQPRWCVSRSTDEPAIPEVSANKYFLNIRFTKPPAGEIKARGCERDVAFDLTFCNL
jgi:cell division protein ZapD